MSIRAAKVRLAEVYQFDHGDLLCNGCSTELRVVTNDFVGYKNPAYEKAWDKDFHTFNNVRVLYPYLIRYINRHISNIRCPVCKSLGLIILEYSMLDPKHVLQSMIGEDTKVKCITCQKEQTADRCLLTGVGKYICVSCLTKPN